MNKSTIVIILTILFFGFLYCVSQLRQQITTSCPDKYPFIATDLNCDDDPSSSTTALKETVQKVIDSHITFTDASRVSVFYRNLNSRQWFGINENALFSPASLLKLPIAIAYYKYAEVEPDVLDKEIKYILSQENNLYNVQNIKPERQLEGNTTYPIRQLIGQMIEYSDNNALAVLSNSLNSDFSKKINIDLGLTIPLSGEMSQDFVSVKVYGGILRMLFNASYLNQNFSNQLLDVMTRTDFKDGLVAGVPHNVVVAHKFGERKFFDISNQKIASVELHDCGIIYDTKDPYILCIMTQGKDYDVLTKIISGISQTVYSNR